MIRGVSFRASGASREAGLWVGAVLLSSGVAAAVWLRAGLPVPDCRLREWTGMPCATCGTTRMLRALLAGDLAEAIALNPMTFAVLAALAAWSLGTSILAPGGSRVQATAPGSRTRRALLIGAAIVLAAGWAYQLWRAV